MTDTRGQAIAMVLCHLPGFTPAGPEPLGQRLEARRAPGLAALAQVPAHSLPQAWAPRSCPSLPLWGARPWVSSTGVPSPSTLRPKPASWAVLFPQEESSVNRTAGRLVAGRR